MRVCHVITDLDDGGAEAVLFRLCTFTDDGALATSHHVVSLMGPGKFGPMLQAAGIPFDCIGMKRGRFSLRGLLDLVHILRRERPDVVQTWMYHANLMGGVASRLARINCIVWGLHQSYLDPATSSRATRIVDWMCARLSRAVPTAIISCSFSGVSQHELLGYDHRKMTVVPNGYDLARFRPDPAARSETRSGLAISPSTILVGMVARWHPVKDHRSLLAALALVKARTALAWRCVLVGSGIDGNNAELTGIIQKLGLEDRIDLMGPQADIPAIMNGLDLHVLSSRVEAFPNVVAEAMACGVPCVVTDVGDAAELVGDTGWVAAPADSMLLADAIEAAIVAASSGALADRARAARSRIIENYSIDRMAGGYQAVWSKAAAQDGPP